MLKKETQTYSSEKLQKLIQKAYNYQWNMDADIDWNQEIIIPEGVGRHDYLDMLSQLYHAELFVIESCSRVILQLDDEEAIFFLCTQLNDESRHALAYKKYIEMIGNLLPINNKVDELFQSTLNWDGSILGSIIVVNILMEGEALNVQNKRIQTLPCPIFREMYSLITRDESRHTAFGHIYLADKVPSLSSYEKNKIYEWVKSLWIGWSKANEGRYSDESAKILRTSTDEFALRFEDQSRILKNIGLISDNINE